MYKIDLYKDNIIELYMSGKGCQSIAKELQLTPTFVWNCLKKYNINRRNNRDKSVQYKCNDYFFSEPFNEYNSYWLGFLSADGYISKYGNSKRIGLSLACEDIKHLEKFRRDLSVETPIHIYQSCGFSTKPYCRILLSSPVMYDRLVELGFTNHKSENLVPVMFNDLELTRHYIRGLMDGDGCIAYNSIKQRYSCRIVGVKSILDYIASYVQSIGMHTTMHYYKRREHQVCWQYDITGSNIASKKFLDSLYRNANIYLDRKYQRYQDLCYLLSRSSPKGED